MAKKQCVRIATDGPFGSASIIDADTGQHLENKVKNVTIEMPPGGPFVATLEVLAEIDLVAEARFELVDVGSKGEGAGAEARRLLAAITDAWLQLPIRVHAPQMTEPIKAAVEWLRTHPARETEG